MQGCKEGHLPVNDIRVQWDHQRGEYTCGYSLISSVLQVTFVYGMGPLAWSIIAFRNSLVFHSLDKASLSLLCTLENEQEKMIVMQMCARGLTQDLLKTEPRWQLWATLCQCKHHEALYVASIVGLHNMKAEWLNRNAAYVQNTSLFLHWFPAVVAWTSRWHSNPNVEEIISKDKALESDWNEASLTQLVFFPMVPYLAWAVAYYAKVCWQFQHFDSLKVFHLSHILGLLRMDLVTVLNRHWVIRWQSFADMSYLCKDVHAFVSF